MSGMEDWPNYLHEGESTAEIVERWYWDAPGVPLAVEKRGKTDCRECCFWGEARMICFMGTDTVPVCTHANYTPVIWGMPEFCGDFVEVVL